jgi:esterase/lipase superfamily enzyme
VTGEPVRGLAVSALVKTRGWELQVVGWVGRLVRSHALICFVIVLAACAPRGFITVAPDAATVGDVVPVFIGTTREYDPATGTFGFVRSETLTYGRFDISVPPNRDAGEIGFPGRRGPADPATDFLTTARVVTPSAQDFEADLRAVLQGRPAGARETVIYVHGFNNTFAEGLYRLAQLSHDLELPGVAVHYSWPSRAAALGYVYDRDSALFARDGLETLIRSVNRAGSERTILVAHSMGTGVLMETLRQLAIAGDRATLDRIAGVILISPDLDVDVFRAQARTIGQLPQPFLIVGSDRDRYLTLSARITGESERLGNLSDIRRVADLEVTYLDVSAFASGGGHFTVGDNPALIRLLGGVDRLDAALARDQRTRRGLLPSVVLSVRNATEVILSPVTAISDDVERRRQQ